MQTYRVINFNFGTKYRLVKSRCLANKNPILLMKGDLKYEISFKKVVYVSKSSIVFNNKL